MDFLHVIKVTLARLYWEISVVLFKLTHKLRLKKKKTEDEKCKELKEFGKIALSASNVLSIMVYLLLMNEVFCILHTL